MIIKDYSPFFQFLYFNVLDLMTFAHVIMKNNFMISSFFIKFSVKS